jgi:hypothetical protein
MPRWNLFRHTWGKQRITLRIVRHWQVHSHQRQDSVRELRCGDLCRQSWSYKVLYMRSRNLFPPPRRICLFNLRVVHHEWALQVAVRAHLCRELCILCKYDGHLIFFSKSFDLKIKMLIYAHY